MKTKIIGLTGGIGSGKSTIAAMFINAGFPVYISDERSKIILNRNDTIQKIISEFGIAVVENGIINRKKLGSIVFENKSRLAKLNNIMHPLVRQDFKDWLVTKNGFPFVVKESAILFESNTDKDCFKVITVSAPLELRIERVVKRDSTTREAVLLRIDQQLTDDDREFRSDFTINNIDLKTSEHSVQVIISSIISMI